MSESKAVEVVDWFGKWVVNENGTRDLVEESKEWIARQKELASTPVPPNPIDVVGNRVVQMEGTMMALEVINEIMGKELIGREFEILRLNTEKKASDKKIADLQSSNAMLGQQVVQLDLRLMKGGIL